MTSARAPAVIVASADAALEARIVERRPLMYGPDEDPGSDRPPFVRAASGVVLFGEELAVIQDDASFIALVRPGEPARAVALPAAASGRRRFEDRLGNKLDKLDLESCVTVPGTKGPRLIAFGSGSLPVRERIVVYDPSSDEAVRVVDGAPLYARLRGERRFSSDALNIEGAVVVRGLLRLFQRGNGELIGGFPIPSTVDVDLAHFLDWIDARTGATPELGVVRQYDLGEIDGARFGFTDATLYGDGRVLFAASAERSPDTVRDGEVVGTRIGWLSEGEARFTPLLDEAGNPARLKGEGIAANPRQSGGLWLVLDPDDTERPAELCDVRLAGPW